MLIYLCISPFFKCNKIHSYLVFVFIKSLWQLITYWKILIAAMRLPMLAKLVLILSGTLVWNGSSIVLEQNFTLHFVNLIIEGPCCTMNEVICWQMFYFSSSVAVKSSRLYVSDVQGCTPGDPLEYKHLCTISFFWSLTLPRESCQSLLD